MKPVNRVPQRAATAERTSEPIVLGNDVVDLHDPDSNPESHPPRFDERVFSPTERACIRANPGLPSLRWWFWAAKEAAFKSARKRDHKVVFSPPRFEVEISLDALEQGELAAGQVVHRSKAGVSERFEFRLWHGDGVVHAVASPATPAASRIAGCAQLIHGYRRLDPTESASGTSVVSAANPAWGPRRAVRRFACG